MIATDSPAAQSRHGIVGGLLTGAVRWELLSPFPIQDAADRRRGEEITAALRAHLRARVDPEAVEARGALPDDYVAGLRAQGLLNLQLGPDLGGRGLSFVNVMRAIEAAMGWCLPAGYVLALQNGFGAGGVLPAIPPGPTLDYVRRHLAAGAVSGWADTEPTGAGNTHAATVARVVPGGYELTGEKIYIVNGSIADLLVVSTALERDGRREARVCFVDTHAPGFRVRMVHELMGLRGLPIAALALERVRVPAEAMLETAAGHWRDTPLLEPISALARMYVIVAASLAVSRRCLAWSAEFVARRGVDGQGLTGYAAIRRLLADNAAEVFAMESVAEAAILGLDHGNLATRWFELVAAKNLASRACARITDRALSLLSAEGYETAPSKARRGAPAVPLERAVRDARAFRIAGGVDFLIDYHAAREALLALDGAAPGEPAPLAAARLSPRNAAHRERIVAEAARLGEAVRALVRRHPAPEDLARHQRPLILIGRLAHELFAMTAALARAAAAPAAEAESWQALADVYCTGAHRRVSAAASELAAGPEPGLERSVEGSLEAALAAASQPAVAP